MRILDTPPSQFPDFQFPIQCLALKLLGAWPLQPDISGWAAARPRPRHYLAILYRCWSYAMIVLITLTCLAQTAYVFSAWGDILTVTECGCTVLMGVHNLLRLIHLNYYRRRLFRLNRMFVRDIWISRYEDKIASADCEADCLIFKLVSGLMFLLICMYVLVPLYELFTASDHSDKPFPYKMVFPYDANAGPVYAFTYILTSVAGFGVVSTLFAEDSLFGFHVAYVCGQLRLLHARIGRLERMRLTQIPGGGVVQGRMQQCLNAIIVKHNMILSFCERMQRFFSPILLVNFTISSMLICLVGFQIASVKMSFGNMAKLLVYIVSALSQLFILCWTGNALIDLSSITATKVYLCNWHSNINQKVALETRNSDVIFMKKVRFIIERCQKPICITAMQFSDLSLKSFSAILSTSMSYFTLLQSLVKKDD